MAPKVSGKPTPYPSLYDPTRPTPLSPRPLLTVSTPSGPLSTLSLAVHVDLPTVPDLKGVWTSHGPPSHPRIKGVWTEGQRPGPLPGSPTGGSPTGGDPESEFVVGKGTDTQGIEKIHDPRVPTLESCVCRPYVSPTHTHTCVNIRLSYGHTPTVRITHVCLSHTRLPLRGHTHTHARVCVYYRRPYLLTVDYTRLLCHTYYCTGLTHVRHTYICLTHTHPFSVVPHKVGSPAVRHTPLSFHLWNENLLWQRKEE